MGQFLFALSSLGVFGYLPWILNLVAIIDVVRVGASWYWIWIILMFPGIGAIAYGASSDRGSNGSWSDTAPSR